MEHRTIVPNRNIILIPLEAHLQIMVIGDELQEISLQDIALAIRDIIDVARGDLSAGRKDALPARYRIGTNDRVHSLEVGTGVFGGAAVFVDQLDAVLVADVDKVGLVVGGGEGLGDFLESGGEAVVGLIAGGPEGVAAGCV